MSDTIDQFEVDSTEIQTFLSPEELEKAQFQQKDGVKICYNFESAQIVLLHDSLLTIIPLGLLRDASKMLHEEYWSRRTKAYWNRQQKHRHNRKGVKS